MYRDARDQYYEKHRHCPKCGGGGGTDNHQTLACPVFDLEHPEIYADHNDVLCITCGWHGKVHDLVGLLQHRQLQQPVSTKGNTMSTQCAQYVEGCELARNPSGSLLIASRMFSAAEVKLSYMTRTGDPIQVEKSGTDVESHCFVCEVDGIDQKLVHSVEVLNAENCLRFTLNYGEMAVVRVLPLEPGDMVRVYHYMQVDPADDAAVGLAGLECLARRAQAGDGKDRDDGGANGQDMIG